VRRRDRQLLRRHEDPEHRVDQDLAAGQDHQDQQEQHAGGPRVDAEAAAEAGADAAQHAVVGPDQALLAEPVVDVVHGDALLSAGRTR